MLRHKHTNIHKHRSSRGSELKHDDHDGCLDSMLTGKVCVVPMAPWPMVRLDGIFQVVIPPSLNGNSDQHGYPVTIISPNFHRGDDDGIPTHGGIPTLLLYESKSLNRNEVSQPIAKIIACHSGIIATVSLQYMSSGQMLYHAQIRIVPYRL